MMQINSVYITIESIDKIGTSFKILRAFDPTVELGPILQKIRSLSCVISRHDLSAKEMANLISMLDALDEANTPYSIAVSSQLRNPESNYVCATKQDLCLQYRQLLEVQRQLLEVERQEKAFELFCKNYEIADGHWVLVEREEEFEPTLSRVMERARSTAVDSMLDEELCYLSVDEFEGILFRGGFGAYLASDEGSSASSLITFLEELESTEVLPILKSAIRLMDPWGGYSTNDSDRVDCISRCPLGLFDDLNLKFCRRTEDVVALALKELEVAYDGLDDNDD